MDRITEQLEEVPVSCGLCGRPGLVIERHVNRRSGFARLNPLWRSEQRTYQVCPECKARQRLIDGRPI